MAVRGYFVQYRFILPDSIKHSSYTYQKLFRAIYGYTQAVNKSSGKNYSYHRPGVLSNYPYTRPGKNCVIIPPAAFQPLQEFFKTGRNPTHNWETKGEWKCTYFLNEKDLKESEVIAALENMLSRRFMDSAEGPVKLLSEMKRALEKGVTAEYREKLVREAAAVAELDWFKQTYAASPELADFYMAYKSLKGSQQVHKSPSSPNAPGEPPTMAK